MQRDAAHQHLPLTHVNFFTASSKPTAQSEYSDWVHNAYRYLQSIDTSKIMDPLIKERIEKVAQLFKRCVEPSTLLDSTAASGKEKLFDTLKRNSKSSSVFKKLNKLIDELQKFVKDNAKERSNFERELLTRIISLIDIYKRFQEYLVKLNDPSKKHAGFLSPAAIATTDVAYLPISEDLDKLLFKYSEPRQYQVKIPTYQLPHKGNSDKSYTHIGNFVKLYGSDQTTTQSSTTSRIPSPVSKPGMALAIQQLQQLILPDPNTSHGPLTEFVLVRTAGVKCGDIGKLYLARISTYAGQGKFDEIIDKNNTQRPPLDSFNFSVNVILSLITSQGYVGPESFTYYSERQQTKNVATHLLNLDYGDAFIQSLHKGPNNTATLSLRNILFCLPEMNRPLNAEVRNQLLQIFPEQLLLRWLHAVNEQNKKFLLLRDNNTFNDEETTTLFKDAGLPLEFSQENVFTLIERLEKIKALIQTKKDITLNAIFAELEPDAALVYKALLEKNSQPISDFFYQTLCNANTNNTKALADVAQKAKPVSPKSKKGIASICEEFVASLEKPKYRQLTDEQQITLYNAQLHLDDLTHPVFAYNNWLTDALLENFLTTRNSSYETTVYSVTLRGCSQLTQEGLKDIITRHQNVRFGIGECAKINPYLYIAEFGLHEEGQLYLIYPEGERCEISKTNNEIAIQAVKNNDEKLLDVLADYYPSTLQAVDNDCNTVLHHACKQGNLFIISQLLKRFAELTTRVNRNGQSAMDFLAVEKTIPDATKYKIYIKLITATQGFIKCDSANDVLKLCVAYEKDAKMPKVTNTHFLINFTFENKAFLSLEFISTVLPTKPFLDFSNSNIDDDSLQLIASKCQNLAQVNLTNCPKITYQGLKIAFAKSKNKVKVGLSFMQAYDFKLISLDHLDSPLNQAKDANFTAYLTVFCINYPLDPKQLRSDQIIKFASALKQHTQLSRLSLINISSDHIPALKTLLLSLKSHPSITEVELVNCGLNDAKEISEFITSCTSLKELNLSSNSFSPEAISQIATTLEKNPSLERLNLYKATTLTAVSCGNLLRSLKTNTTLSTLALNECSLPNQAYTEMGNLLESQRVRTQGITLKDIDIGFNSPMEDISVHVQPLCETVKKLKKEKHLGRLQFIRFGGNYIANNTLIDELRALNLFLFINIGTGYVLTKLEERTIRHPRQPLVVSANITPTTVADSIDENLREKGKHTWRTIQENIEHFLLRYQNALALNPNNKKLYEELYSKYKNLYEPMVMIMEDKYKTEGEAVAAVSAITWTDVTSDQDIAQQMIEEHYKRDKNYQSTLSSLTERRALIVGEKRKALGTFPAELSIRDENDGISYDSVASCVKKYKKEEKFSDEDFIRYDNYLESYPRKDKVIALSYVLKSQIIILTPSGSIVNMDQFNNNEQYQTLHTTLSAALANRRQYIQDDEVSDNKEDKQHDPIFILKNGPDEYQSLKLAKNVSGADLLQKLLQLEKGIDYHITSVNPEIAIKAFGSEEEVEKVKNYSAEEKAAAIRQLDVLINESSALRKASIAESAFAELIMKFASDALRQVGLAGDLFRYRSAEARPSNHDNYAPLPAEALRPEDSTAKGSPSSADYGSLPSGIQIPKNSDTPTKTPGRPLNYGRLLPEAPEKPKDKGKQPVTYTTLPPAPRL